MPQRKRKDNPGKRDRVQPPLKTRLPVTGHPQSQHPQPPHPQSAHPQSATATTPTQPHQSPSLPKQQATVAEYTASDDEESIGYQESDTKSDTDECSEEDPAISLLLGGGIYRSQSEGQKEESDTTRAIWCLRELMKFINLDLEPVFKDEPFRVAAQQFTRFLNDNGAAWVNDTPPFPSTISPTSPPPPPTSVTDTSTQTIPPTPAQKPMTNSVSTNTDHPVPTYTEAATGQKQSVKPQKGKGKGKESAGASSPPPPAYRKVTPPPNPSPNLRKTTQARTQAVVLHAAPTKYKPGLMRRWIEDDNKNAQIKGIRWLLLEGRRVGKAASSLVIYLAEEINLKNGLRMGKRLFRTTAYNWDA
ncbi:hypothetical protein BGX38DRAFT_1275130 [Terfezia claveryi]|nr:hypothetical protein BGX38DRAFT_1275130 [Terfezia claveryi]